MMQKKLFLIFTQVGKLRPKLYRIQAKATKLITQYPQYKIRQFDNQNIAENIKLIYQMEHKRYLLRQKETAEETKFQLQNQNNKIFLNLNTQIPNLNTEKIDQTHTNTFQTSKKTQTEPQSTTPYSEIYKAKQSLMNLTPVMPRLLHYYSPTKIYEPIKSSLLYTGYFDGCSKSNPGPSGAGYYLTYQQKIILSNSCPLGKKTSNQAELSALLYLLIDSYVNGIRRIDFYGDSKLAIGIAEGSMKASNLNIVDYAEAIKKIVQLFSYKKFSFISRAYNSRADKLSNDGVRKKLKVQKIVERFQHPNQQ